MIPNPLVNIVWFKRDLRITDHQPLLQAARQGPVIALYIFEPTVMTAADYAAQHAQFALECLTELEPQLSSLNIPLMVFRAEVVDVLQQVELLLGEFSLFSHEETGNALTYQRDIAVAAWCKKQAIDWIETPSHGVVRRLKDRDRWSSIWDKRMSSDVLCCPTSQDVVRTQSSRANAKKLETIAGWIPLAGVVASCSDTLKLSELPLHDKLDKTTRMRGGRRQALDLLESFLAERGVDYRRQMSSPLGAEEACSRLSPYIAMGVLSVREVVHRLWATRARLLAHGSPKLDLRAIPMLLASLKSFESRLHWRCHFVQKLESQPSIEWRNQHSAYDALRQEPCNLQLLAAWSAGKTGFPMIDACMKMLLATGWINFRMRAMLVSFASYQLWLHWREPALHLARQFLDYEPGIHYSQCQMQSGTTGINTIRMYNPVKQARDQDPHGEFVRRWLPALEQVPNEWIFEPWSMPTILQQHAQCIIGKDYPAPIIDLVAASRTARDQVWAVREQKPFDKEAKAIYQKLGSRNPSRQGRRPKAAGSTLRQTDLTRDVAPDTDQLSLF